ncbi:MAG TPA: hypothetical protein VLL94_10445 [Nitrospiraceae bacterium]|nr:hypothetical protein [Nitrospiraceae bacterium]
MQEKTSQATLDNRTLAEDWRDLPHRHLLFYFAAHYSTLNIHPACGLHGKGELCIPFGNII